MSFKEKYLKYKNRYLALKLINIQGGVPNKRPQSINIHKMNEDQIFASVIYLSKSGVLEILQKLDFKYKDNIKFISKAILENNEGLNEEALEYASDRIKDDKEFILLLLKKPNINKFVIYKFISDKLKSDKEIVLNVFGSVIDEDAIIKNISKNLFITSELFEFISELLYKSAKVDPDESDNEKKYRISSYISTNLKINQTIKQTALDSVKNNGLLLEYVFNNMDDDEEVVMEALKQNVEAHTYISERLLENRKIQLFILERGPKIFFINDKQLIIDAINAAAKTAKQTRKYTGPRLETIHKDLENNVEIITALKAAGV